MLNGVAFNQEFPVIEKSNQLYERTKNLIPAGTQTLAKGVTQYVNGVAPKFLVTGKGARVWDADGNEYIDFNMGIGPVSLGYNYDRVDNAIKRQLDNGITFSLMHPLEVEVAELINEVIPNAEAVRFSKGGADVTSAAIRVARAYTGKEKILCCGYHGWHDWYISVTTRNSGIPNQVQGLTNTFNYNDIEGLKNSIDDNTAAVILEPVVFEHPHDGFLEKVAQICQEKNVPLIFDEMWTGFRLSLGGAQEYFNVKADLAVFSKAVANGMPLSVITGKKEIMNLFDEDVFFFNTFGGEALSLAAAKVTIQEMKNKNVPSYLREKGKLIKEGYNDIVMKLGLDYTECIGMDCRTMVTFKESAADALLQKSYVQQELIRKGILWSGFHNLSFSHTDEEIFYLLKSYEEILPKLDRAIKTNTLAEKIEGIPVQSVFRKTSDFNMKPVTR
ncbi:MAG: aminotransferase class III-fold pyridoxal phosphate-dependent enzyme [Rhodothermaceae bacterium]